jgi:hypothetical protein
LASCHFAGSTFKICSYVNYRKTSRCLNLNTERERERERERRAAVLQTLLKKIVKDRGKSMPVQANCSTRRFQEVETPRFLYSRHMQMVRISALLIGHLYALRKYSSYSFLLQAVRVIIGPEE